MRKYLIENVSDRTQQFMGNTLSRVRGSRPGGSIWVTEEAMSSPTLSGMISAGRLKVINIVPPLPVEEIEPIKTEPVVEVEAPVSVTVEVPANDEGEPEPEALIEAVADSLPEVDYSSMKVSELRALLKEKGLYSKSLKKKADMINVLESS